MHDAKKKVWKKTFSDFCLTGSGKMKNFEICLNGALHSLRESQSEKKNLPKVKHCLKILTSELQKFTDMADISV